MLPTLKLTYFDAPGRAEPIRVALALAGLPFEDHRLNFAEFGALKQQGAFPLGSVPVLYVDGEPMAQTAAMLRFAARLGKTHLYPEDAVEAFLVDSVVDTFNDTLSNAMMPSFFERDQAKKLEMRAAVAAGPMRLAFAYAERLIGRGPGPFLLGQQLTIADLVVAQQVLSIRAGVLDGIGPQVLEAYPNLLRLAEAYLADPRVAAYHSRTAG
jgi:glutathione S-transferase